MCKSHLSGSSYIVYNYFFIVYYTRIFEITIYCTSPWILKRLTYTLRTLYYKPMVTIGVFVLKEGLYCFKNIKKFIVVG